MTTLNKAAAELVTGGFAVHAMTDVTGFGLIGHAREMAIGSGVSLQLFASQVRLLPGALECVRAGFIPGGLNANRDFAEGCVQYGDGISADVVTLLYDPQTAGGLLISVASPDAGRLVSALHNSGVPAAAIGDVTERERARIRVQP
jgi:selenide,water dikinase